MKAVNDQPPLLWVALTDQAGNELERTPWKNVHTNNFERIVCGDDVRFYPTKVNFPVKWWKVYFGEHAKVPWIARELPHVIWTNGGCVTLYSFHIHLVRDDIENCKLCNKPIEVFSENLASEEPPGGAFEL